MHRSIKYLSLGLGAGLISIGAVLLCNTPVSASSITIAIGSAVSSNGASIEDIFKVHPSVFHPYDTVQYYFPVEIQFNDLINSPFYVSLQGLRCLDKNCITKEASTTNTLDLVSSTDGDSNVLASVSSSKALDDMQNEWGYRYSINDGEMINDSNTDNNGNIRLYGAMPTASTTILADTANTAKKTLTLGFAARVNAEQKPGDYTGQALVSVLATPNTLPTMFSIKTMQEMTSNYCNNTPTPSSNATISSRDLGEITNHIDQTTSKSSLIPETILEDTRDGKKYLIRKLADGECWMIQNLALDSGTTEETRRTISNADSDMASGSYTLPISTTEGFDKNGTPEEITSDPLAGQYMYNGTHIDAEYDNLPTNTGGYYSWLTATVNSNTTGSGNAPNSICPKAWGLPQAIGDKSLNNVLLVYGSRDQIARVWNYGGTGNWQNRTLMNSVKAAAWWSKTAISTTDACDAYLNPTGFTSFNCHSGFSRLTGLSVRCIAD